MSDVFKHRWVVRVTGDPGRRPYVREVTTDGPWPERAITRALDRIVDDENDLWMCNEVTVKAEHVR